MFVSEAPRSGYRHLLTDTTNILVNPPSVHERVVSGVSQEMERAQACGKARFTGSANE